MGGLVEAAGVNLFTQFGGAELIYEGEGIAGVITEDKGIDKNGQPKANFTPGYELRAKVTVLAEGTARLAHQALVEKKNLDNINPQIYGIGIKELWDVQPGRIEPGFVAHTLGWPRFQRHVRRRLDLRPRENRVSIGLVVGLEYAQSAFRSRTQLFRNARRIRFSTKFSKAASSSATARKPCLTAAGTPCRAIISMAA